MWVGTIAGLLAMATTVSPPGTDPSATAAGSSQPIITRQTCFAIPFRVGEPQRGSPRPAEVQLYVSSDWGATWRLQDRANPAARQFLFRAPTDGEYWFAVRTLDSSGQLQPRQPGPPGLRVVVDTLMPTLQFEAERGQAGEVVGRWRITEPNLKLDSLQVSYGPSADGPWQPVAVNRPDTAAGGNVHTGEVTWWPAAGTEEIHVRAEVCDKAGHPAHCQTRVRPKQDTAFRPPHGTASLAAGGTDPRPSQLAGNDATVWRPSSTERSETWPSNRQPNGPLAGNPDAADRPGTPWNGQPGGQPDGHYGNQQQYGGPTSDPPPGTTTNEYYPPIGNQYLPPEREGTSPSGGGSHDAENGATTDDRPAAQEHPTGERPRMVNSQSFELVYDADRSTAWETGLVTVWGTCDGGQSWQKFATDDDNCSPMVVKVDQEGTYGFRTTRSGTGTADRPPQSGELPEVVVGVDWTKPTARITSAQQGYGPQSDRLIVSWQADDRTLAARPVTLSFAAGAAGPWTTIAAGLENTGNYAWRVDCRVPERVYLRLQVKDEAGNEESFVTTQVISLQWPRPKVNIREVRPLGRTGRTSAKSYYFK